MKALIIFTLVTIVLCFAFFLLQKLNFEIEKLEDKIKMEGDSDSKSLEIRILNIFPILIWIIIGLFMFFCASIAIHVYTIGHISSVNIEIIEVHEENQELQRKIEYYDGYIRYLEKRLDTSNINHQWFTGGLFIMIFSVLRRFLSNCLNIFD